MHFSYFVRSVFKPVLGKSVSHRKLSSCSNFKYLAITDVDELIRENLQM